MAKMDSAQKKAAAMLRKKKLESMTDEELVADMRYEDCAIEHIIAWCKLNNQVEWLKLKMQEEIPVIDKETNEPTGEMREMDFMTLKRDFNKQFGHEGKGLKLLPKNFKKEAKPQPLNMFDKVAML